MKKILFALLAFACMALPFAACSDDDDETPAAQQEVAVTVGEVTDSTARLSCVYNPVRSATYQLRIGDVVSDAFSEGVKLEVQNLAPGKRYDVEATAYDANHNEVSTSKVEFITTGTPENKEGLTNDTNDSQPTNTTITITITAETHDGEDDNEK